MLQKEQSKTDDLLQLYLQASEAAAQEILATLVAERVEPLVKQIVRRKLCSDGRTLTLAGVRMRKIEDITVLLQTEHREFERHGAAQLEGARRHAKEILVDPICTRSCSQLRGASGILCGIPEKSNPGRKEKTKFEMRKNGVRNAGMRGTSK